MKYERPVSDDLHRRRCNEPNVWNLIDSTSKKVAGLPIQRSNVSWRDTDEIERTVIDTCHWCDDRACPVLRPIGHGDK